MKKELQTEVKTEHEPDTLQLCLSAGDSVGRRGRGGGGACMSTERRHTDSRYTARIYDHGAQYHVGSADGGRRGVKRGASSPLCAHSDRMSILLARMTVITFPCITLHQRPLTTDDSVV